MQTEHLKIKGMTCGGCPTKITRALKSLSGVVEVNVSLSNADATIQFDEKLISPEQLKMAINEAGYGVGNSDNSTPRSKGGCCG